MEAAIAEIKVPGNLEDARRSAQAALDRLTEEAQEISHLIYVEGQSIERLAAERSEILAEDPPEDDDRMAKLTSIAAQIEKSREAIASLDGARSTKQLKISTATATLRDAGMKISNIVKAALISQIASGETELAQMEESLRTETPALEGLIAERRAASHGFSIGKEKREKVQQLGAKISESQNHITGITSAIEPAHAALATLRAELQNIESKLSDAQALNQIDGIKERGERVAETIRKKFTEAFDALSSLSEIEEELKPFLPYQKPHRDQSEVNIAAKACAQKIYSYRSDARDAARDR